jgi:hypothetical protein
MAEVEGTFNGDIGPDYQMPGLPGRGGVGPTDGIAAEITTFIELPAGWHTNVVNSEDCFRTTAGNINDLFRAQVAGEFDQPAGRTPANTVFPIYVHEAGTYAFRTVLEAGGNGASIEWKLRKPDGATILIDDVSNGGFPTHGRLAPGAALPTGINMVSPLPDATGVPRGTALFASIQEGAATVDLNSVRLRLDGSLVSSTPARAGSLISVRYQPPSILSSMQHAATLSYTAGGISRTQSWNFTIEAYTAFPVTIQRAGNQIDVIWNEPGVVLQESTDLVTWTDLTAATSPYRPTGPRPFVFYRLKK